MGQPRVHPGKPAAGDPDRPGRGGLEADGILQVAPRQLQQMADLGTGQVERPGDPRPRQAQRGNPARPRRAAAQQQRGHHLGTDRPSGAPLRPRRGVVLLGHTGPQVHPPSIGEGVPQRALGGGQFVVDQHGHRVRPPHGPWPGRIVSRGSATRHGDRQAAAARRGLTHPSGPLLRGVVPPDAARECGREVKEMRVYFRLGRPEMSLAPTCGERRSSGVVRWAGSGRPSALIGGVRWRCRAFRMWSGAG